MNELDFVANNLGLVVGKWAGGLDPWDLSEDNLEDN